MNATNEIYTAPDDMAVQRDEVKMELKRKLKEDSSRMKLRKRRPVMSEIMEDLFTGDSNEDGNGSEEDGELEESQEEVEEKDEIEEGEEESLGESVEEAPTDETEMNLDASVIEDKKVIGI